MKEESSGQDKVPLAMESFYTEWFRSSHNISVEASRTRTFSLRRSTEMHEAPATSTSTKTEHQGPHCGRGSGNQYSIQVRRIFRLGHACFVATKLSRENVTSERLAEVVTPPDWNFDDSVWHCI